MITRSQHWTDRQLRPGSHRRTISNWCNYKTPGNDWAPSAPGLVAMPSPPPNWEGAWDFSEGSLAGPAQIFTRNALTVGQRAMIGLRVAEYPGSWINWLARNTTGADRVISNNGQTVTWAGIWPGCDLIVDIGRHKAKETIKIWDKALAPSYFEFSLRVPGSHTIEIDEAATTYRVLDSLGEERIKTNPLWAHDSATTGLGVDGQQSVGVTLSDQGVSQGLRIIRITPDPNDMANAIGDVFIDPTTTISGAANQYDTMVRASAGDTNWGGSTLLITSKTASPDFRSIFSIASAAIPSGTISRGELFLSRISGGGTYGAHSILSANSGWVEGTQNGVLQSGTACYNYLSYNTTTWAGSAGLRTADTDYNSTYYDTETWSSGSAYTGILFDPASVTAWRTLATNSGGMLIVTAPSASGETRWQSSDSSTNPAYWEIDYTVGPSGFLKSFMDRRH